MSENDKKEKFVPNILISPSILDKKDEDGVNRLLKLLSKESNVELDHNTLTNILAQPNFEIVIFKDPQTGEIIGMASFIHGKTLKKTLGMGSIQDVVVDDRYRGKGLGRLVMKYLFYLGKQLGLEKFELTSNPDNPDRKEAIELYKSLGFKERAGYFYLDLK